MERAPADVYMEHCRRRELAYQVDEQGQPVFRPRVGDRLQWRVSAGRGTVYSTTVAHPRGSEAYNIVLVDLEEGFRMMATVVGVEDPRDVAVGARVALAWREGEEDGDAPVPVFELVDPPEIAAAAS